MPGNGEPYGTDGTGTFGFGGRLPLENGTALRHQVRHPKTHTHTHQEVHGRKGDWMSLVCLIVLFFCRLAGFVGLDFLFL